MSQLDLFRRSAKALAADPAEFLERVASEVREWPERRRPVRSYEADDDWFGAIHEQLGRSTPCGEADELAPLWDAVLAELISKGVMTGPRSYLGWNDGDAGLVRAIWCLVRHLNASKVVETGVAHGVTSRFILEALSRNGGGHLWSIDLPPQLHPELHIQIGVAVEGALREEWTYIKGSSRRRLPALLREIGPIDLFVHDSKHSADNVLFELGQAWAVLRPGGAMVVDDVDASNGFHLFRRAVQGCRAFVCEAEPIRPDERRSNLKGWFGVIIKPPATDAHPSDASRARRLET
jgi:hypothetical protein